MKLTSEQEGIIRGESGQVLGLALKTLVDYGEAFGAGRLVPIRSGHVAGSMGIRPFRAYYAILDRLVAEEVRVSVPTTVNPRPGHDRNLPSRIVFGQQKRLDRRFEALGITPNYSCACYDSANVPAFGDRLAWAESSAVAFANSVLGARTNRNSTLIDICSAVTGLTPEFGFLLDEHRRGQVLVRLEAKHVDASGLGFIIGREVVDRVPVLERIDLTPAELKNMGGSMAASGGVALYHIEGVTPEAPDLASVFDGEPERTITVTQGDLDALRADDPGRAALVVFGCPQMTFEEATALGERFAGRRVTRPTWFCMIPEALERFEATDLGGRVREAGVELFDHCPLGALTMRSERKEVLTPSGKLFYYLKGTAYGTVEDCLRAAGGES